jgi:hypothetical protein
MYVGAVGCHVLRELTLTSKVTVSKADALAQRNSRNMLEIRNDGPESLYTLDVVWLESS